MNKEFLIFLFAFLLTPSFAFAECEIPDGAQVRNMRVSARSGIYNNGDYSSGFAVNYSLLEDYQVQVIGEPENGFYQICYEQRNSGVLAPISGYMPAENLTEVGSGTDQLGPSCGFREVSELASTPRMDRGVITETIAAVEMNQSTGYFDPCTDIGNFTAGSPVNVIRYGTDTTGERWARVRVHSTNYGVIEGWLPANKIRIDYEGLTEGGYQPCTDCGHHDQDIFGDIREIRDNILPPGVTPHMYCNRNQGARACMVCNCYREAGSSSAEPYEGRLAVVLTTIQRSEAPTVGWPNDICSVVYQGENRRYPQFEWTGQSSTRRLGSRRAISECVAAANQGMASDTPWPYDHFVNLNTYGSPSWFRACNGYRRSGDNRDSWNNPRCYGPRSSRPSHCMNFCEPSEISANCIRRIGNHWFCHGPMPYTLQH